MTEPTARTTRGLRWTDFEDSERWKVAVGVWWRIVVLSVGLWLAAVVLLGLIGLIAIQFS